MDSNVRTGSIPVRGTFNLSWKHSERDFFVFTHCFGTSQFYIWAKKRMARQRTKEEFEKAAKQAFSIAGMCRNLGLKPCGGNYRLMHNAIEKHNIDTEHFRGKGWNIGLVFRPNKTKHISEILTQYSTYQSYKLKNRLLLEGLKQHICECCGNTTWNGKKIPLELHHINGNNRDNRLENLKLLCPNCHALTDSYRGKNNGSKKKRK